MTQDYSGQAGSVKIVDELGIRATVRNLAANDALNVAIVDGSGNQITSFGGTSMTDDSAFTAGSSSMVPVGGIVTADSVDSGDTGAFAMLANRQQKITLYDSSGVEVTNLGGTQYTEADTDASITGTAILWEDTSDTLRAVSAAKPLPVGDAGGSLTVDNAQLSVVGSGTEAAAMRVTIATDSTGVLSVDDNSASLSVDWNGTQPVTGSGTATGALRVELPTNGTGVLATVGTVTTVSTVTAMGAGTTGPMKAEDVAHATGDQGFAVWAVRDDTLDARSGSENDYEPFHTNADGALWVSQAPSATGGLSTYAATGQDSAAVGVLSATAQAIKASAGVLYGWYIYNPNGVVSYVVLYNTAAASVTVGTTAPLFVLAIPPGAASNISFPSGIGFSNAGWSAAAATTAGGNTAPTTGLEAVFFYK